MESPCLERQFSYWYGAKFHRRMVAVYLKCENESRTTFYQLIFQVFSCVNNPVKYVHQAAFRGLLVLKRLKLGHTQLHQLPSLQHIGHSLEYLDISLSRHFTGNDAQNFAYLRKIKTLNMYHNRLSRTPLGLNLIANTITALRFAYNTIISLTSIEGVEFIKLSILRLESNNIAHLRPEYLITPRLTVLNLEGNHLVSLAEVTQYSWGSLLPEHEYMLIALRQNPWHCNGSFSWMFSNLYNLGSEMIYARPPAKAYIYNVNRLICKSPDTCHDTTVVPLDVIESVNISIRFWSDLAGKCYFQFVSKVKINFINLKLFITSERLPILVSIQTIRTTLIDVD